LIGDVLASIGAVLVIAGPGLVVVQYLIWLRTGVWHPINIRMIFDAISVSTPPALDAILQLPLWLSMFMVGLVTQNCQNCLASGQCGPSYTGVGVLWVALVLSGLIDFSDTACACVIVIGISRACELCLSFDLPAQAGYRTSPEAADAD
jgi:hypothetical protein